MSEVSVGSEVLVYREKPKKWMGPFRVIDASDKQLFVEVNGRIVQFSIDKVKLYNQDKNKSSRHPDIVTESTTSSAPQNPLDTLDEMIRGMRIDLDALVPEVNEDPIGVDEINTVSEGITNSSEVLLTKVLPPNDPEGDSELFRESKLKEVRGLRDRDTWDFVDREMTLMMQTRLVEDLFLQ